MKYKDILADCFGVVPKGIQEVIGGFSAKAYKVDAEDCNYFLKVYDKSLPTMRPFIERIDAYMPVLGWLSGTPELGRNIVKPISTLDGGYKVETAEYVFLLFEYVQGETPGEKGLTCAQSAELAKILAHLHGVSESIPFETTGLSEDISIPFCAKLEHYLAEVNFGHNELSRLVCPNAEMLRTAIAETIRLRDTVRTGAKPLVLCHADAHSFNVIQSDHLVLVDWEDLRWAPAEADLFIQANCPNWAEFLKTYSAIRPHFRINADMMRFYLIRRRLDDIWIDVERITCEKPNEAETNQMFGWIRQALSELQKLLPRPSA